MKNHKEQLLQRLRDHILFIRKKIEADMKKVEVHAHKSTRDIARLRPEEQSVAMQLKGHAIQRMEELEHLHQAPYFIKCEVVEQDTSETKTYFFAKHQLSDESVYSWVAPIASIRFENPGDVSYTVQGGGKKKLLLNTKEQYLIVDGEVLFFAREDGNTPRELIFQAHFTKQKSEFILPEIVAQMEKAQDQVIRAHYRGPLIISGPAGSGKTTLALHRVAYLTQAPDTATLYPAKLIIVFVQDNGTKEYFSHLLPGLGIHNVIITTFSEWALDMLALQGFSYISRYGTTEEEKDSYEYQKIKALRSEKIPQYSKNTFTFLAETYTDLSVDGKKLLDQQKKQKTLDRFDLTILLNAYWETYQKFEKRRSFTSVVNGVMKNRTAKTPIEYSLIVVDEFQNYLPEQLKIFNICLNQQTKSCIYVGDIAQQVYLGTIKNWDQIGETIEAERNIKLDKVYRNTKSILAFIQNLGYPISLPEGLKEGPPVTEKICSTVKEEIEHIKGVIGAYAKGSVGILAKNDTYLTPFKAEFSEMKNIHVLTMNESQGVEFDLVCIVGIDERTFVVNHHADALSEHIEERKRMQKDLLYVALTRPINELHILGKILLPRQLTR